MSSDNTKLDAYERVLLQPTQGFQVFLFVGHMVDANHLTLGFGIESESKLQRHHVFGPQVHEAHTGHIANWLRRKGLPVLVFEPIMARQHPFSSTMNVDIPVFLESVDSMPLAVGRYAPLLNPDCEIDRALSIRYAEAIERVSIKAFGNPHDWDVRFAELADGRFVWMAYDADIDKIRLGIGFHDADNEKQFGHHTYAVDKLQAAGFAAFHYHYLDAPLQFVGIPPRWPPGLEAWVVGSAKQKFSTAFLKLADEVWPGQLDG